MVYGTLGRSYDDHTEITGFILRESNEAIYFDAIDKKIWIGKSLILNSDKIDFPLAVINKWEVEIVIPDWLADKEDIC